MISEKKTIRKEGEQPQWSKKKEEKENCKKV
jgi:hypothetical protein